jgi:hypothetical protein
LRNYAGELSELLRRKVDLVSKRACENRSGEKSFRKPGFFMRRDGLLLADIVAAADAVAEFTAGHTPETLAGNILVRSAVVH